MVLKLDQVAPREAIGWTAKFPKWAVAYKFAPVEVTSLLKDIIWQIGRTGKLTPIAVVDPVTLAGATVTRATLNNMGDIVRKKSKLAQLCLLGAAMKLFLKFYPLRKNSQIRLKLKSQLIAQFVITNLLKLVQTYFAQTKRAVENK